ncbi:MAG: metallophosphoesterase [Thermoplasmata archaeon]
MARRGYRLAEGIEILEGGAALLSDDNVLVVADMHLGCEAALEYEGLSIPRVQTKKIESYMVDLIDSVGPRRVVVAGDLKHNFSRNLVQEWSDISRFIDALVRLAPLEVIKGNHDNFLGIILKEFSIPLRKTIQTGGMTIAHGHEPLRVRRQIVMGHLHPSVRLKDRIGAGLKDPCFLWDDSRRILVLPALSIVASGVDVASQLSADRMSPILSDLGLSSFRPIVFSGNKALKFPTIGEMRAAR